MKQLLKIVPLLTSIAMMPNLHMNQSNNQQTQTNWNIWNAQSKAMPEGFFVTNEQVRNINHVVTAKDWININFSISDAKKIVAGQLKLTDYLSQLNWNIAQPNYWINQAQFQNIWKNRIGQYILNNQLLNELTKYSNSYGAIMKFQTTFIDDASRKQTFSVSYLDTDAYIIYQPFSGWHNLDDIEKYSNVKKRNSGPLSLGLSHQAWDWLCQPDNFTVNNIKGLIALFPQDKWPNTEITENLLNALAEQTFESFNQLQNLFNNYTNGWYIEDTADGQFIGIDAE